MKNSSKGPREIGEILPNAVYTTEEAAKLLNLDVLTVQKYVRRGLIKATKIGNKWYRIRGQDLLEFMGVDHLEIPSVMLEHALVSLDLKREIPAGEPIPSRFYNIASSLKAIAMDSKTKADLYAQLAGFIEELNKDR